MGRRCNPALPCIETMLAGRVFHHFYVRPVDLVDEWTLSVAREAALQRRTRLTKAPLLGAVEVATLPPRSSAGAVGARAYGGIHACNSFEVITLALPSCAAHRRLGRRSVAAQCLQPDRSVQQAVCPAPDHRDEQ